MKPKTFTLQKKDRIPDGIGGYDDGWVELTKCKGYLDLSAGTNLNASQNSYAEQSTHVLIVTEYDSLATDAKRVVDEYGRYYSVNYVDDPMGQGHHLEIYLTYGGAANGR